MKAMILAAGLGTRMRPVNRDIEKPALPVLDEPLVVTLVTHLARQGIDSVVVNTHGDSSRMREILADAPIPVQVSHEAELLGSGGGILAARPHLDGNGPFLVLNADMRLELDVAALLEAHERGGALGTLALRSDPRYRKFGSIGYDASGNACRIRQLDLGGEVGSGLFIGVHLLEPRVFDHMPDGTFEVIADAYFPALRAGEQLHTWLQPDECEWTPIGEPRELLDANLASLRRRLEAAGDTAGVIDDASARIEGEVHGPAWVGQDVFIEAGARVGPWAVVSAGARVPKGACVEHALLLPRAQPPSSRLAHAIGYGREVWSDA